MRESANGQNSVQSQELLTVVAQVDRHGKLIALASTAPVQVVLISDEPGMPFGVEVIDGPTSTIPSEVLEIAETMRRAGRSVVFQDGPIHWRYNDVRHWWEAHYEGQIILHVELPKGQFPAPDARAMAKDLANDEFIN